MGTPFIRPQIVDLGMSFAARQAIESEIERLIALLDAFDGDSDLEDDDPAGDPTDEGEQEQLVHDVPSIAIYGNEVADDGRRPFLGFTIGRLENRGAGRDVLTGEIEYGLVAPRA